MEKEGLLGKVVVLVLAVAVLATLADAAASRRRPEPQPRVLSVTAEAYEEAEPNIARISLGIKATRPKPAEAAAQVAQTVAAVQAALTRLGVPPDAVETSELYLGEATEYDYSTGRTVKLGYKAYHWLRVTLKQEAFGKLAAVVDGAVGAGATSFSGLVFEVENENALRATALAKATERAREKAQAMARAGGASIVGVQSLSEDYGDGYYPGGYGAKVQYRSAASPGAAPAAPAEAPPGMAPPSTPAEAPPGEPAVPGKVRITCDVVAEFLVR